MNEDRQRRLLIVANVSREHIRKFHIPFIEHMKGRGWRVDVACRLDAPIPECDRAFDLPCDRNPFRGGILKSARLCRDIIEREKYDAVLCNTLTGSIVARLARKMSAHRSVTTPPVIYINHGLHYFTGAPLHRWLLGYPLERMLAPLCDVFVAINDADYEMARRTLHVRRIERLNGIGVSLDSFPAPAPSTDERRAIREELGCECDDTLIVYTAEINRNKNQRLLLRALKELLITVPTARLLLVGPEHDGGKARRLADKMKLSDRVVFAGWRSDVPRILSACDLYAASSLSEGLPVNLLEAMASGLPVVAAENRGHAQLIRDGENGYLVAQGDACAMARHLAALASDSGERERIVTAALDSIACYDINSVMLDEEQIVLFCVGDAPNEKARERERKNLCF